MENHETVFDILKRFAAQKAGDSTVNVYHMLYGYAQLAGMQDNVLSQVLSSEEDMKEVEAIRHAAEAYGIDFDIMKKGLPLLLMEKSQEDAQTLDGILENLKKETDQNGHVPADVLFSRIVDANADFLEIFKQGHTLEDILKYRAKLSADNRAKHAAEEEKQAQEAGKQEERPSDGTEEKQTEASERKVGSQPKEAENRQEAPGEAGSAAAGRDFPELARVAQELSLQLLDEVKGQDDAVRIFVQGYFQAELMSQAKRDKNNPRAVFLFAGPPGVGKTFLATTAAAALKLKVKRFNMSEYSDSQSTIELIGLSKKYSGASRGALTSFVRENPKGILIFDEIEKAHLNVIHLFLQILDAGCLKDSYDEKDVSFKDNIIIFTTNVGKKLYEENREQNLSLLDPGVVLDALQKETSPITGRPLFPGAICSRFAAGNVVMFNHLSCHHLLQIVRKNFDACAAMMQEAYQYQLTFDPKLASVFLFGQSSNMDARIISSQSSLFIQNELYEFARQAVEEVDLHKLREICFEVKVPEDDPEIAGLFCNSSVQRILVVADRSLTEQMAVKTEKLELLFADSQEEMTRLLMQYDISFVLIDPRLGYEEGMENGFSMDDLPTEGIHCFNHVRSSMPQTPVYLLESGAKMRAVDKNTFMQRGGRGVITFMEGRELFLEQILSLADVIYLQEQINELSKQEKVLHYNTAQKTDEGGERAIIEFYDFRLQTAVRADNQQAIMSDRQKPATRFCDIIGAKNARDELQYFIRYLKNPKEFALKGLKPPKGVLLYGPPGTGKTMLAKAMAGEAGVTFLPATAADFPNKWVGEGEENIRRLFAAARKYAPSVIFIDEIDAIAKERTGGESGQYREGLLNVLLTEMDGFAFDPKRPVFVLAATNFPIDREKSRNGVVIDPALLRRFDNKILVDLPNQEERREFLEKRLAKIKTAQVSAGALDNIAERTTGESLANIQNVIDLALRNSERRNIPFDDRVLLDAMEEYYYGEEHKWGRAYYESVAHHEAGHAYVCWRSGEKPSFVTIVSRGDFGGYMQHGGQEKTPGYTKEQLLWRIRTSLAGRASEIVFYGEEAGNNTGVSSDLQNATNLALQMICRYGMSGSSLLSIEPERMLNTMAGERILRQAEEILEREMERTMELIREGRDQIDRLSQALLEQNQLMGKQIEEIFADGVQKA